MMVRKDLERAKSLWVEEAKDDAKEQEERQKSARFAYRDRDGRVFDFHALRHRFVSGLAKGRFSPCCSAIGPSLGHQAHNADLHPSRPGGRRWSTQFVASAAGKSSYSVRTTRSR